MSFLHKILGGKATKQTADLKPRSPRIRIPLVDHAVFVAANGKVYAIRNLSESGLALLSPGELFPEKVKGELRVGGDGVAVELLVARRNGDEIGIAFGDGAANVRGLLRRVFVDELHALEMTEVDSARQKAVEVGKPRWFYAPGNYELFFVEHEERVIRFEMEWNGNILAYANGQLRFGHIDRDLREEVAHARSSLVKWQDGVSHDEKMKALRLLENIPSLGEQPRQQMQLFIRA